MTEVDHIVVAGATLDDGVRWCEALLGVAPAAGGQHALMGTHNRVLNIGSETFSRCYLEIIAIDPDAAPPQEGRKRWFDLDDSALQERLRNDGPRLVHWVARCAGLDALCARVDVGTPRAALRATAHGELRWRISVRDDGRRGKGGALPTLIEWGDAHPCDHVPASGVVLRSLAVAGLDSEYHVLQLADCGVVRAGHSAAALTVELDTPRGRVRITT